MKILFHNLGASMKVCTSQLGSDSSAGSGSGDPQTNKEEASTVSNTGRARYSHLGISCIRIVCEINLLLKDIIPVCFTRQIDYHQRIWGFIVNNSLPRETPRPSASVGQSDRPHCVWWWTLLLAITPIPQPGLHLSQLKPVDLLWSTLELSSSRQEPLQWTFGCDLL